MWQLILFIIILIVIIAAVYFGANRGIIPSVILGLTIATLFLVVVLPGMGLRGPAMANVPITATICVSVTIIVVLAVYQAMTGPRRNEKMVMLDGIVD